jgi:hypothetical protein
MICLFSVSDVAEAYRRRGGKVLWGLLLAGFTFFRAIFHILPIAGPLLAPFEFEVAALANFWREAVLSLCPHGDRLQTNRAPLTQRSPKVLMC